jgi:predicted SAM-dependent methyltransferase
MLKLHLGCGPDYKEGYTNVDIRAEVRADLHADVRQLPLEDAAVDEILARNILEHFPAAETVSVLQEWRRVLRPDGVLTIIVPDIHYWTQQYLNHIIKSDDFVYRMYGGQTSSHDFHYTGFDDPLIRQFCLDAGFGQSNILVNSYADALHCIARK